jgi:hypothetical protein
MEVFIVEGKKDTKIFEDLPCTGILFLTASS